jgi:putative ABC transport system permease protein
MFLDMTLRSLGRNKIRSGLTLFGVTLAIAAIVGLGSFSEGISVLVEEQLELASDFIAVAEEGSTDMSSGPPGLSSKIDKELVNDIAQIDGVESVSPQIRALSPSNNLFVVGFDIEDAEFFDLENIGFEEGGWPEEGVKEVVVGYQVSESLDLTVGDELKLMDDTYIVSGIMEELQNFMDYGTLTSLEAAAETFDMEDSYTVLVVEPADVGESKRIASEIEELDDTLEAITTEDAIERTRESIDQVRIMTLSIGIVASIVASIGIVNTMIMIVLERKKEFGIMKALGAERLTILYIVMQEAIFLGAVGSIIGIGIGFFVTDLVNSVSGFPIAMVTLNLAFFSFLYGILLTVLASVYPAYQAIKVDPVEAMRK